MMRNLTINAERLWGDLMETARIGGTPKGGICRLTLTELDRQVRDWFRAQAEALGCRVTVDDMGAMFARRDGLQQRCDARVVGGQGAVEDFLGEVHKWGQTPIKLIAPRRINSIGV